MNQNDIKMLLTYADKELVYGVLDKVNLTEQELIVLCMVDMQGLTYEQACEKLNCSISTIYRKRQKGLNKIMTCYKDKDIKELIRN